MHRLANPTVFLSLVARLVPALVVLDLLVLAAGLYGAALAPDDYQQGATVKIMYIHVPMAMLGMAAWALMAVAALGTLVWRHPLADVAMKSAAPLGAAFTLLCLMTGALWGQPTWGTWWVWDARLTSVLILFLMYLGVLALWRAIEDPGQAARACAVLVLVGAVNLPIIRFSVDWWNTLHQGSSNLLAPSSQMDPAMRTPLLIMLVGCSLLFVTLHLLAMRNEILRRRVRTMRLMAAAAPDPAAALIGAGA
jgi:heme exporter protein C